MLQQGDSIKYTAVLPKEHLGELRRMAERNEIPSINQGIRAAVKDYVDTHRLSEYQREMREATEDEAFVRRTMDTQAAFEFVDAEGEAAW
jgi:metal-responsive CopG/Arc/MetJ family transcriptional regulator